MATVLGRELMDSDLRTGTGHPFPTTSALSYVFLPLSLSLSFFGGAAYPQERTPWLETRMTTTWTLLLAS